MARPKQESKRVQVWCFYCMDRPAEYEGKLTGHGRAFDLCGLCVELLEREPSFLARVVDRMAVVERGEQGDGRYYC